MEGVERWGRERTSFFSPSTFSPREETDEGAVGMGVWSLPFKRLPPPQFTKAEPTQPPGAMLLGWVFPLPAPLQTLNAHAFV
jgi:hypothetical protein